MCQKYFEYILYPSQEVEIFADFLSDCISQYFGNMDYASIEYIQQDSIFNEYKTHIQWENVNSLNYAQITKTSQQTMLIARLPEHISSFSQSLRDFCHTLGTRLQTNIGCAYAIMQKDNKNWIQAYKDSIQPIVCEQFLITPSWQSASQKDNTLSNPHLIPIVIDPALAFGSGHHASTIMCIKMLNSLKLDNKKVLDVGCGSGILSIIAAKLGAQVYACDTDSLSIQETKKNIAHNNTTICHIWEGSMESLKEDLTFNVIVANILAITLKMLYKDFIKHLANDGILILSGILETYKNDVLKTFLQSFSLIETCITQEWVALKMKKLDSIQSS